VLKEFKQNLVSTMMNQKKIFTQAGLFLLGGLIFLAPNNSYLQDNDTPDILINEDSTDTQADEEIAESDVETDSLAADTLVVLIGNVDNGMNLFQGKTRFENHGPSCVTCHNVTNDQVIPGGLFAKDLTDVYERLGEGLSSWLMAPPFPAMATSYVNNPLTERERVDLTAFFKYANETKADQSSNNGYYLFCLGSGFGLLVILFLIQLLWGKRKRKMVKADIFNRQIKAWDAKF
jgi:hypothetical protein